MDAKENKVDCLVILKKGIGKESGKEYACLEITLKNTMLGDVKLSKNIFLTDLELKLIANA